MKSTTTAKFISLFGLGILSFLGLVAFAADPSFSINPTSTGLKLHCNYVMGLMLKPGALSYNGFESHIKFDSGNVAVTHSSITPLMPLGAAGLIKSGFLYKTQGGSSIGLNGDLQVATFGFVTTQNIINTTLEFVGITGQAFTYGLFTTTDGEVINSSISSYDILTGKTDATYTFLPLPCIIDNEEPLMSNNIPSNNATNIPVAQIISFLVYDWIGAGSVSGPAPLGNNNRSHYRYSGLDNNNLNNYQLAPVGNTVDNQQGVNSGSIKVTLTCTGCILGSRPYVLTTPDLNITTWTGNGSINKFTRDSQDRGYTVNFPAPSPYEIEKLVTVTVTERDNANENGNVHTGIDSFYFNAPVLPTIVRNIPAGSTNVDYNIGSIEFQFSDTWAGVNSGTISITIPAIWSGAVLIYTGYTYSGSDLSYTLISGTPGTGNAGSYTGSFVPKRPFPSNTDIRLTGSVYDYANNKGVYDQTFKTKMSCADWGCSDFFTLNILGGPSYIFTGNLIIITGTNLSSPYPYLTGLNNDILMCGLPYTGTILTGNIGIYDTTGTQINGVLYTGDVLYITGLDGLDFTFTNGVITIQ